MLSRFVSSASAMPRDPVVDDPAGIEDVRAVVRLRSHRGIDDLVIATELGGGVRVLAGDRSRLPQRARAQLAFHDVASGAVVEVEADELYVFDLQMLELLPDAPGPNDPLYLYGPLRGPYPAMLGRPVTAVDGQLMVTRADLLAGLIDGVGRAFAYAPETRGSRCAHALLPGEHAAAIDAGRGVVLALPLAPVWTLESTVANDLVVAQVVHDVLAALRTDLGITAPLPVPSRAALEDRLVAAGWRIEGDRAVRAKGKGLIGSVFGGSERKTLPRQGTLDELIAEAKAALAVMPGIPSAEATALRRRAGRSAPVVARAIPPPPRPPTPPPVSAPASPPPSTARPQVETPRSDWMKDFVDAHRDPARPAPQLSTPARAVTPAAKPAWMDDFAEPTDAPDAPDAPSDAPEARPDWSKDFD